MHSAYMRVRVRLELVLLRVSCIFSKRLYYSNALKCIHILNYLSLILIFSERNDGSIHVEGNP